MNQRGPKVPNAKCLCTREEGQNVDAAVIPVAFEPETAQAQLITMPVETEDTAVAIRIAHNRARKHEHPSTKALVDPIPVSEHELRVPQAEIGLEVTTSLADHPLAIDTLPMFFTMKENRSDLVDLINRDHGLDILE